jgi:hypothetical protein
MHARDPGRDHPEKRPPRPVLEAAQLLKRVARGEARQTSSFVNYGVRVVAGRRTDTLEECREDLLRRKRGGPRDGGRRRIRTLGRRRPLLGGRRQLLGRRRRLFARDANARERLFARLLQELAAVRGKEPEQRDGRFCSLGKSDEFTKDRSKGLVEHSEPMERVTFRMDRAAFEELTDTTG